MKRIPLRTPRLNLAYPGLLAILIVGTARILGLFQIGELRVLDSFLRFRPAEATDDRITIVEITDADIEALATYPIPDRIMVEALSKIQQHDPRAVGVDIFRNFPTYGPPNAAGVVDTASYDEFIQIVQNNDHVFVVDRIVPPVIPPPPGIPLEQVGFADAKLDADGFVRRSLLGSPDVSDRYRFSLTVLLAQAYLKHEGFELANSDRDPVAMQFSDVALASAHSASQGYVMRDSGNNPILLINFRSGSAPFQTLSLTQLLTTEAPAEWFQDRIVLIGMTARSAKDFVNSEVVSTIGPGLVSGVEMQAHTISQILSAVLDGRPILKTWPTLWEYVWILGWGLTGIGLSRVIRMPFLNLVVVVISTAGIFLLGYGLLLLGWWIPVVPAGFLYFLNGAVLYSFYWYGQSVELRISERQQVIQQSYSAIHNGPLQTLSYMLQALHSDEWPRPKLQDELKRLDTELRSVHEFMAKEALDPKNPLYLTGELVVDLSEPLHEVLYQIYINTVVRPLPYFADIQVHTTQFKPLVEKTLSPEQKRGIAIFFEEALCNVGQYARDVQQLVIVCQPAEGTNIIRVIDDGKGFAKEPPSESSRHGRGTRQAIAIAKKLAGTFQRRANYPQGTICELQWPIQPPKSWQFWR